MIASDERSCRLLIIDDTSSLREGLRKILGAPSPQAISFDPDPVSPGWVFEIDAAAQGQEGLALLENAVAAGRPYAVAFVDLRLPGGWDGAETVRCLWQIAPDLQIVLCRASSHHPSEEVASRLGHTESLVILKEPFDRFEVLQLTHTLAQKWMLAQRLRTHLQSLDQTVVHRTEELQAANNRLRLEIVEREQAQRELDHSEERFAKAFQSSPVPMAIQSLTTQRYCDLNAAFVLVTGYRRDEIVGRTPAELGLITDPEAGEQIALRLSRDQSLRDFTCTVLAKDGARHECTLSAETIVLGIDRVALIVVQDVSNQRRLEKLLRQSQKLEAVGQLAAGVAHDFNNVLTIIQGHATMQLAAAELDPDLANSFDQISLAAERAAALTRQLLAFSRKQLVLPRWLSLNETVENLREMLGRLIGEHIELGCELAPDLPEIYADESNMEQIVMNLVVNARDAMPGSGRITIRTAVVEIADAAHKPHPDSRPGRFAQLSVSDNGCGMSQQTLNHIFEPFFTTKEVGKGSGLGLATVYGIVAQHEGWLDVESELGCGTTFHVHLPLSALPDSGRPPQREPAGREDEEVRGGHETILLVEDEPEVREVVTGILETHGYRVFSAADGLEAIALWQRTPGVDLLVTDMVMPNGLKGDDLAERLRAEKPELKVIYSSGYSREIACDPLVDEMCFLEKPYKFDDLLRVVRSRLDTGLC